MNNKKVEIHNYSPHYTNRDFRTAQTVWGEKVDGLSYDYSDRFSMWDYDKKGAACDFANKQAKQCTAEWVELFLSYFFDKPIEIVHIMAGHNLSDGYPYQVFGYREQK